MTDLVLVEMTTNLFHHSRMNGFLLPPLGERVEVDEDSAERLVAAKHAEVVEVDETPDPEPAQDPVPGPAPQPTPEPEQPAKRGPGRPRKNPE